MKVPNYILTILSVLSLNSQLIHAQLLGIATLAGQSDHSGIKVKFTASSGTAVTDSCLTGSSGSFSINISGGLYSVSFSKSGYQTILYNNGNITALTNTVVLSTTTLAPGTASYVSGSVSGTWSSNTMYYVQGDLDVASGTTLNILPGTEIKFFGNYTLTVNGVLNAAGTSASPIKFVVNGTTQAGPVIDLHNGPNTLDYCQIDHFYGINSFNSTTKISNCQISNSNVGIGWLDGNITIENNDILNAKLAGLIGSTSSGTITCNRIKAPLYKNNFADFNWGMHINGSELVADNDISECQVGVYLYFTSNTPKLINNYIHDNKAALSIDENQASALVVSNNTIAKNDFGIFSNHPGLTLSNNIIASSGIAIQGDNIACDHNLIFNCTTNFSLTTPAPGLGQIVNTNSNGDPIDSYYNIFLDPEFGTLPFVQSTSPALNAGNSVYSSYIGVPYSTNTCFRPITTSLNQYKENVFFKIYPNPAKGIFIAELSDASRIRVYDLSGKEILNQQAYDGGNTINIMDHPPGIYVCMIEGKKGIATVKLINL